MALYVFIKKILVYWTLLHMFEMRHRTMKSFKMTLQVAILKLRFTYSTFSLPLGISVSSFADGF